jgi:hypothetical protein
VVTDYAHYDDFLPYLADIEVEPRTGGGCRMSGRARSAFRGWWDFSLTVRVDRSSPIWRAYWEEAGDSEVQVNRGGWAVSEKGPDQTLLVLTLEAEVRGTPTFILRNTFLQRLPRVMSAVGERLDEESASGR